MFTQSESNLFLFDQKVQEGVHGHIAGVDEAGRGPLAGPVVAAAVVFFKDRSFPSEFTYLNDSKKLTPVKREKLYKLILSNALVGIGVASEECIDTINIYQATRVAMRRAVIALTHTPDFLLIDGNMRLDLPLPQKAIIKGDQKSASIAAASIIAKVYRDFIMMHLDSLYPNYLFKKHKGYGTKEHLKRIEEFGPASVHRKSFKPISEALEMRK